MRVLPSADDHLCHLNNDTPQLQTCSQSESSAMLFAKYANFVLVSHNVNGQRFTSEKIKNVCVKTVVVGRSRKCTIRMPLTVDVGSKNQAIPINLIIIVSKGLMARTTIFFNEEVIIAPDNSAEESTTHKRTTSNFCNWEKICLLLKASFEDASFPINDAPMCNVSMNDAPMCRVCVCPLHT